MELDGVPLLNEISVAHPEVHLKDHALLVSWEAYQTHEEVKIWLANTNQFKTLGKMDDYVLIGESDISKQEYAIPLPKKKEKFYKVVIEGKYNMVNRWIQID